MRLVILSPNATSLMNVARDIAYVAQKMGHQPMLFDQIISPREILDMADGAIIISVGNVATASTWMTLYRDLKKLQFPAVLYTTIEGRIPRIHIHPWHIRELEFIACSHYVRQRMVEAGLRVIDVVPHGVNLDEMEIAMKMRDIARKYIEEKVGPGVVFCTVSNAHKRKGLMFYAREIRKVVEQTDDAKFFIVTEERGVHHFTGIKNTYVESKFGGRTRMDILALMSACDWYVQPSLIEGFGLPPLESMAMGVPIIHMAYAPLIEYSEPTFAIHVPYKDVKFEPMMDGLEYELHYYEPGAFAKAILEALDIKLNQPDRYQEMSRLAMEKAKQYDVMNTYPKLINYVVNQYSGR